MFSALLYLQFHSFKNRVVSRFKRLKQPKYLVGAIVGLIYFYWYFFRNLFRLGHQRVSLGPLIPPDVLSLLEPLGALLLLVIVVLAWFIPHERAALTFSEAEIAFLFPAPIERSGLIHFKLLRSQARILLTTLLLALVSNRFGGHPVIRAAGWWLILSTLNLHFLGSSFALTMLLDRGITNWTRRLAILLLAGLAAGAVFLWAKQSLPALNPAQLHNFDALRDYARQLFASGPLPWLLFPFRLLVRPFLAPDLMTFLSTVGPALLLFALHYVWVVRSNVAFEEASIGASKKLADRIATIRAGNWQTATRSRKAKRPPFTLRPLGPRPVALLWKNLLGIGHGFTLRLWFVLAAVSIAFCGALAPVAAKSSVLTLVGMFAGMLLIWSLMIGPQLLRQDFRHDLPQADILKTFPMPGWQIALGEILAPAAVLTGFQWFMLILAAGLLWNTESTVLEKPLRLGIAAGAGVILPVLNLIILQIPNAAVLLFPSWFQVSRDGAHGIEATGQRLIFVLGQFLAFVVALLPAAGFFVAAFFLVKILLGPAIAVSVASLVAAVILAIEAALGILLLGLLFSRLDLSAESNP